MSVSSPAWASALGVVAVVLGIFLTAMNGNELMKHAIITQPAGGEEQLAEPDCPPDELAEEGVSLAECEQLVAHVRTITVSRPDWFRGFYMSLAALGAVVAFASIVVGAALIDGRGWAPGAAMLNFGALTALDVIGFVAVVNAGPLLRDFYLWQLLLWFLIHLMMTVAAVVGRQGGPLPRPAAAHGRTELPADRA
jgi:hypothetical protein